MKKQRRIFITALAALMVLASTAACSGNSSTEGGAAADADSYPKEPITVVVPFAAGGGGDTMIRTIEPYWSNTLGGNFVVENMGGSGTQIGMTEIKNAGANPYSIGVISQPHTSLTIDVQQAPYTLEDFYCINLHNFDPQSFFVQANAPWNDCVELFDYIRENPGEVTIGVSQMTGGHLFAAYMQEELGLDFVIVPYDGGSTCRTALLGGLIDVMIMNEAASASLGEDGRCIGVNWTESNFWEGAQTIAEQFPDDPKLAEVGIACANLKFVGVNVALKEQHPDVFDKLVSTYKEAYLDEAHLDICREQGLYEYMKWYGPEESQALWYSAQELVADYAYLFK